MGPPTTPPMESRPRKWLLPASNNFSKKRRSLSGVDCLDPNTKRVRNFLAQLDRGKGLLFARVSRGIVMHRQDLFKFVVLNLRPKATSQAINDVLDSLPFDSAFRISHANWTKKVGEWMSTASP
mmetsp:Transcript_23/g.22  ORF Transcript_23/g.22 Transcript_23/m.22 type:complete len:124 (+) Transcript_23:70-441(+)